MPFWRENGEKIPLSVAKHVYGLPARKPLLLGILWGDAKPEKSLVLENGAG